MINKEICEGCPYNYPLTSVYDVYFPLQLEQECGECMRKRNEELDNKKKGE
ncbi:hypothetical protein LCGC14_1505350 [marine sediment metagenome]|uniref:Uncharacterized protein n=1 Tax=marine sediment metagenome TaxID=412755 RepID=A0A0F9LI76_9ZZZZ